MKFIAYHGSNTPITRFNRDFSAQGVFWFHTDKDHILRGESGASSIKYIIEVELTVRKTAGWEEYEKLGLGQITDLGFDSIKLDDNWVIFSPRNIRIIKSEEIVRSMTVSDVLKIYADTPKLKFDSYSYDANKLYYSINDVPYVASRVPEYGRKTFMKLYHSNANKAAIDYMEDNFDVDRVYMDDTGSEEGFNRLIGDLEGI